MKTTFKSFLLEAAVTPLSRQALDLDEAVPLIKEHCQSALKAMLAGKSLYRGWHNQTLCMLIDTTRSKRRSENTSNYYTQIFDSNPSNADWPKRSTSLICSNKKGVAEDFGNVTLLFPYDGTAIAHTTHYDIWVTEFNFNGKSCGIEDLNHQLVELTNNMLECGLFAKVGEQRAFLDHITYDSLKDALNTAKKKGLLSRCTPAYWINSGDDLGTVADAFADALLDFYSFENLGFTKTSDLMSMHDTPVEVWFSGKCVAVPLEVIDHLKEMLKDE